MSTSLSLLSKIVIVLAIFSRHAFAQAAQAMSKSRSLVTQVEAKTNSMVQSHAAFMSVQKTGDFKLICAQKEMTVPCMDSYLDSKLKKAISPVESTLLMAEVVTAAFTVSLSASMPKKVAQCEKIYLLGFWSQRVLNARIDAAAGLPDYQKLTTDEERTEWQDMLKATQASLPKLTTDVHRKMKESLMESLQSFSETNTDAETDSCSRKLRKFVSQF